MMSVSDRLRFTIGSSVVVLALCGALAHSQGEIVDPASKGLPNPNPTVIKNWGELPAGRTWGMTAGVEAGPDGQIWAYERCGANTCEGSNLDPVLKFDRKTGKLLKSFGGGTMVFPHGLHVDREGNVWLTDGLANKEKTIGMQVLKFSPEGKILMRLGKAGVGASTPDAFDEPCDVITTPNGDIFVSDGHRGQNENTPSAGGRIIKFTKDGKYIKEWGKWGSAPGEFKTPHAFAFDSKGRLFVADRGNHRIQIFDQDGKYVGEYKQFSRPSGLFIDKKDTLFVIDSETNPRRHPGWSTGVRIGNAKEDKVFAFIPPHKSDAPSGVAGEGITVDPDGNVYAAEGPISRKIAEGGLTKYVTK
jgi:DNA-binding beta-propeller fold protein YncE